MRVVLALGLVLLMGACGDDGDDVAVFEVTTTDCEFGMEEPCLTVGAASPKTGRYELQSIDETDAEIRIEIAAETFDLAGEAVEELVSMTLDAPLGDRAVYVNGDLIHP